MNQFDPQTFYEQTLPKKNSTNPLTSLLGTGIGGAAGAGLGVLFNKLTGIGDPWATSTIGMMLGAPAGWIASEKLNPLYKQDDIDAQNTAISNLNPKDRDSLYAWYGKQMFPYHLG